MSFHTILFALKVWSLGIQPKHRGSAAFLTFVSNNVLGHLAKKQVKSTSAVS
uniref:Uncharacterized protein n=1 Tax=Anguilla anguilla TaxID=7936 RepID=A0A0E9T050_ANGAN